MLLLSRPDTEQKIALLSRSARFDLSSPGEGQTQLPLEDWPSGFMARPSSSPASCSSAPLMKVMLTNSCPNSCLYCAFRGGAKIRRTTLQPEELAGAFMDLYRRGRASGLFLSSGLGGDAARTMESMLKAAEILRHRHRFPGYLHLKILPGATEQYVEAACRLADRVSANLEVPSSGRLDSLCPEKRFQDDLVSPLRMVARIRRREPVLSFGHITQFVVGAAGESDSEILGAAARLYSEASLTRAYYSAFNPLPGTPLEGRPATPLRRTCRLHQADALLRQYGFSLEELATDEKGCLPLDRDPKTEWALRHPERFPLEVNRASREELLRVPGVGPRTVNRLLRARRKGEIIGQEDLKRLSLPSRAAPFLLANGRRLESDSPMQMTLW